jgi:hypothetical protein
MVRRQMRRVASIYTFIGTAKLTEANRAAEAG